MPIMQIETQMIGAHDQTMLTRLSGSDVRNDAAKIRSVDNESLHLSY